MHGRFVIGVKRQPLAGYGEKAGRAWAMRQHELDIAVSGMARWIGRPRLQTLNSNGLRSAAENLGDAGGTIQQCTFVFAGSEIAFQDHVGTGGHAITQQRKHHGEAGIAQAT